MERVVWYAVGNCWVVRAPIEEALDPAAVRAAEGDDEEMTDQYMIRFPSGRIRADVGRFVILALEDLEEGCVAPAILPPALDDDSEPVVILDPRVVVRDSRGALLYEPRPWLRVLQEDVRAWLHDNPDWPPPGDRL